MNKDMLKKEQDKVNEIIYAAIEEIVKRHSWGMAIFSLQLNMLAMLGAIKEECKKEGNYKEKKTAYTYTPTGPNSKKKA